MTSLDCENERLAALEQYDVLDTPAGHSFDRITKIVVNALDVPLAAVTLIDGHRAWHKSRQGALPTEAPKVHSFCNIAIRDTEPLVVTDAAADDQFKENPYVLGPPHLRAYLGAQLCAPNGYKLGTLCAIDTKPRVFDARQVTLLKDLAAMVMSELEAHKLARTDSLTGILTRGAFRAEAERAIALATRHRHDLSCIIFDLDHFKSINDTHGHAVGDRVLIETVDIGRARLRTSDIFGRIGGEEFAVALPHTNGAGALAVAEGIRAAFGQCTPAPGVGLTATFGVAAFEHSPLPLDELLRRADTVLYEAKEAGRNRCAMWRNVVDPTIMRRVLKADRSPSTPGALTVRLHRTGPLSAWREPGSDQYRGNSGSLQAHHRKRWRFACMQHDRQAWLTDRSVIPLRTWRATSRAVFAPPGHT